MISIMNNRFIDYTVVIHLWLKLWKWKSKVVLLCFTWGWRWRHDDLCNLGSKMQNVWGEETDSHWLYSVTVQVLGLCEEAAAPAGNPQTHNTTTNQLFFFAFARRFLLYYNYSFLTVRKFSLSPSFCHILILTSSDCFIYIFNHPLPYLVSVLGYSRWINKETKRSFWDRYKRRTQQKRGLFHFSAPLDLHKLGTLGRGV